MRPWGAGVACRLRSRLCLLLGTELESVCLGMELMEACLIGDMACVGYRVAGLHTQRCLTAAVVSAACLAGRCWSWHCWVLYLPSHPCRCAMLNTHCKARMFAYAWCCLRDTDNAALWALCCEHQRLTLSCWDSLVDTGDVRDCTPPTARFLLWAVSHSSKVGVMCTGYCMGRAEQLRPMQHLW